MLPINLFMKPFSAAEAILCVAVILLGIAAQYQKRAEPNHVSTGTSIFSHREKARMLHVVQAFCLGMACALFGVTLFIMHEHTRYGLAPSINILVTHPIQPTAAPHENR